MSNPAKRKGSAFEKEVAEYLQAHGFPHAHRRVSEGRNDKGDIGGVMGVVLETKSLKSLDIAGGVKEMLKEQENAGAAYGVAVFKRRQHSVNQAYAVMTLEQLIRLLLIRDRVIERAIAADDDKQA